MIVWTLCRGLMGGRVGFTELDYGSWVIVAKR
jgi:hypothetical protein